MAYNFLTQAAGDARYVSAPGSFGAAGSMSAIDQGDTANAGVATSYARIDHQHALNIHGLTVCTSGTRPSLPAAGDQIFETDTGKTLMYDGTSWWTIGILGNTATDHTPTITQSGTVAKTVAYSKYRIINGVCEWWFKLDITGAGTAGSVVFLSTPVNINTSASQHCGAGVILDSSVPTIDAGSWEVASITTIALSVGEGTNNLWGATPNIGLASGDSIRGHVRFLVANAA